MSLAVQKIKVFCRGRGIDNFIKTDRSKSVCPNLALLKQIFSRRKFMINKFIVWYQEYSACLTFQLEIKVTKELLVGSVSICSGVYRQQYFCGVISYSQGSAQDAPLRHLC